MCPLSLRKTGRKSESCWPIETLKFESKVWPRRGCLRAPARRNIIIQKRKRFTTSLTALAGSGSGAMCAKLARAMQSRYHQGKNISCGTLGTRRFAFSVVALQLMRTTTPSLRNLRLSDDGRAFGIGNTYYVQSSLRLSIPGYHLLTAQSS